MQGCIGYVWGLERHENCYVGIGLNSLYNTGVLCLGYHYNTGPYINLSHFGNSNLGKLPCVSGFVAVGVHRLCNLFLLGFMVYGLGV